jgi:hypothetical protein
LGRHGDLVVWEEHFYLCIIIAMAKLTFFLLKMSFIMRVSFWVVLLVELTRGASISKPDYEDAYLRMEVSQNCCVDIERDGCCSPLFSRMLPCGVVDLRMKTLIFAWR